MCGHNHSNLINLGRDNHQNTSHHESMLVDQQQAATRPCPKCSTPAQEDFVFCPSCGTQLLTACPECHRAVETLWTHCAFCGAELAAA